MKKYQTETRPAEDPRSGAARRASIQAKRRLDAFWEGRRVWVPQRTHVDFVQFRNHPDAERELLTWYEDVDTQWSTGAYKDTSTGGSMFKFWQDRYDEQWPRPVVRRDTTPEWARES